jgi:hypothetical protein
MKRKFKMKTKETKITLPEPTYSVYIKCRENRTGGNICKGQENDDWPSHDDECVEFNIDGVRATPDHWVETKEVYFDPKEYIGKMVYILTVRYDTGNTFGRTLNDWKIVACSTDGEELTKLKKAIEKDPENGGDLSKYIDYRSWVGYFERFRSACVECFILDP